MHEYDCSNHHNTFHCSTDAVLRKSGPYAKSWMYKSLKGRGPGIIAANRKMLGKFLKQMKNNNKFVCILSNIKICTTI